ncbi:MAG TPA: hypothetical protein VIN03_11990 [Roseateles sp.]
MPAINRLSTVSDLQSSDLIALFSGALGNDAAATLATLLAWLQGQLTDATAPVTQYAAPGASGFSVTIAPPTTGASVFLLLQPGGAYAAGTLVLPTGVDGQEVVVHTRQAITALTVTPASGQTTSGAPTTIAQNGFFRLRFDQINQLWARVG